MLQVCGAGVVIASVSARLLLPSAWVSCAVLRFFIELQRLIAELLLQLVPGLLMWAMACSCCCFSWSSQCLQLSMGLCLLVDQRRFLPGNAGELFSGLRELLGRL